MLQQIPQLILIIMDFNQAILHQNHTSKMPILLTTPIISCNTKKLYKLLKTQGILIINTDKNR